jgi:hypothetical protein
MRHRLWLLAFPMWTKPLCRGWVGRGISRFPPKKLLHMPGSSTTLGRPDARADASDHVAFRLRNSVGAQDANLYEAQRLAYALPYRRFAVALADDRARLEVDVGRYSFIVSDLHRLLLAGLSGALRKILDTTRCY